VTLGSSGAVSSQTAQAKSGLKVTKTASKTGRYTVQLKAADDSTMDYYELLYAHAVVVGADDTAYTDAKGSLCLIRDIDVGEGAKDGTFEIQLVDPTDHADAEAIDNAKILIHVVLATSSV